MVFGLIGKVIDVNRGLSSVMGPKFGESRARAYARRLRRLGVSEAKIKEHIKNAEKRGSIKKVMKQMENLVKIMHREGKLIFHIMEKEDVVEYDAINHIKECHVIVEKLKKTVDSEGKYAQRVTRMARIMEGLAQLQFGKLSYLMEGGRPWEGITTIATWDMGTTENVILGEALKQRRMIKTFEKMMNAVYAHADRIVKGQAKKNTQTKLEKALKKAESSFDDLTGSIKMQFYCSLRLVDFLEQEIKSEENMVHHFKEEGFPELNARKIMKEYQLEMERIKKRETKEQSRLRLEMNEAARAA